MMRTSVKLIEVLVLMFLMTQCGGSTRHILESITVSPSSATAVSPNGTAQFTAVGNFNSAPLTQNILVSWTAAAPLTATINGNGLATCIAPSAPGNPVLIQATFQGTDPTASLGVTGTASLTCQ